MFLIVCIVLFVVFCIVEASGADWVQEQIYANRRASAIIDAINSSTNAITSCNRNIWEEQKQALIDKQNQQYKDVDEITRFQDEHGRWFRERLIYDSEGRIIAKEVIGVEQ